jgi:hypothetical protein
VAKTTISQSVTFSSLTAADYAVNGTKQAYECAYLDLLDTTYCVEVSGGVSWRSGIAINSVATAARRAASVAFTTQIATTIATAAQLNTAIVVAAGTNFAAQFVAKLATVVAATGFAVTVPPASSVTASTASAVQTNAAGNVVSSSASALVPSLLTGVAALFAMLAMW